MMQDRKTKLSGSHRCSVRVSQQNCFGLDFEKESSSVTSPQTHVTATAVGCLCVCECVCVDTQAKEISGCGVTVKRDVKGIFHACQVGSGLRRTERVYDTEAWDS